MHESEDDLLRRALRSYEENLKFRTSKLYESTRDANGMLDRTIAYALESELCAIERILKQL